MNLDADGDTTMLTDDLPSLAYLQYSSGSTRTPAGVMVLHRNLETNFQQLMRSFFADSRTTLPSEAAIVSWLPFYHDMGLVLGIISGAERVKPATLHRFVDRFAHFNFRDHMMLPSYGLAEATVFVATGTWSETTPAACFDAAALATDRVQPCPSGKGTALGRQRRIQLDHGQPRGAA